MKKEEEKKKKKEEEKKKKKKEGKEEKIVQNFLKAFDNAPPNAKYTISARVPDFYRQLKKIIKNDRSKEERIFKRIKLLWYSRLWRPGDSSSDRKVKYNLCITTVIKNVLIDILHIYPLI